MKEIAAIIDIDHLREEASNSRPGSDAEAWDMLVYDIENRLCGRVNQHLILSQVTTVSPVLKT